MSTMRLKVMGGPSIHTLRVVDLETGRLLPVIDLTFTANPKDGFTAARVTLLIHETDVTLDAAEVVEEVKHLPASIGVVS